MVAVPHLSLSRDGHPTGRSKGRAEQKDVAATACSVQDAEQRSVVLGQTTNNQDNKSNSTVFGLILDGSRECKLSFAFDVNSLVVEIRLGEVYSCHEQRAGAGSGELVFGPDGLQLSYFCLLQELLLHCQRSYNWNPHRQAYTTPSIRDPHVVLTLWLVQQRIHGVEQVGMCLFECRRSCF
jgi:hypothetical protein